MKMSDHTYKKYQSYTFEELLQDDFFISSMLYPTEETDEFWVKALEEKVISLNNYKLARYFINSVQVKPEPISMEETYNLWENIEVANKQNIRNKKRRLTFYLSVAAGVAAFLALILAINVITPETPIEIATVNIENIKGPKNTTSDIQLILADNEAISLEGKEAEITYNKNGIAINNEETGLSNNVADKSQYNQLVVPFGKRSMLTLAEGTKIWVNAGTRVVYPIAFNEKNREIYIDGEAYLEVSKDKKRPFIVKTRDMSVKVLGTAFNIMAYEDDTVQNIVLVEGSVQVTSSGKKEESILSPNEMFQLTDGKLEIKTVNVKDYTSWINGIYQYDSEHLGTIVKRLSRYYGEDIICSPSASQLPCSGKLDLKENLQQVLRGITHTAPVTYLHNGQTHTITNK